MEWLAQNWIWLLLFVAALFFFTRRGHGGAMGCCGMAHEGPGEAKPQGADTPRPLAKEAGEQDAKPAESSHRHRGGGC